MSIPAWAGETFLYPGRRGQLGVYPRVGGGNAALNSLSVPRRGLSPRGRGKRFSPGFPGRSFRSIPAWAGETPPPINRPPLSGVYPRVGGGNQPGKPPPPGQKGLSPRGRGKLRVECPATAGAGSIPAWAGETDGLVDKPALHLVYPRVGGGNYDPDLDPSFDDGLSPRGRGKHADTFGSR